MMPGARCIYATLDDLIGPCARTAAARWLSKAEWQQFHQYRSHERQATWLAGRVLAKRLVIDCGAYSARPQRLVPSGIEIRSRLQDGRGKRPVVLVQDEQLLCNLSIAHTSRGALVALLPVGGARVGVDLVERAGCDARRLRPWWTTVERRWIARGASERAAPLWAAKEALFKACNDGESFAPRQVEVLSAMSGQIHCCYRGRNLGLDCTVQTWSVDRQVAALAVVRDAARRDYEPGLLHREPQQ